MHLPIVAISQPYFHTMIEETETWESVPGQISSRPYKMMNQDEYSASVLDIGDPIRFSDDVLESIIDNIQLSNHPEQAKILQSIRFWNHALKVFQEFNLSEWFEFYQSVQTTYHESFTNMLFGKNDRWLQNHYQIKDHVWVRDTTGQLLVAIIKDTRWNSDIPQILITYSGFGNGWDEWLPLSSNRIIYHMRDLFHNNQQENDPPPSSRDDILRPQDTSPLCRWRLSKEKWEMVNSPVNLSAYERKFGLWILKDLIYRRFSPHIRSELYSRYDKLIEDEQFPALHEDNCDILSQSPPPTNWILQAMVTMKAYQKDAKPEYLKILKSIPQVVNRESFWMMVLDEQPNSQLIIDAMLQVMNDITPNLIVRILEFLNYHSETFPISELMIKSIQKHDSDTLCLLAIHKNKKELLAIMSAILQADVCVD